MQAALYQTEFRPVPLEEFMKVGHVIYNKKMEVVRSIRKGADLGGKDPDHVVELCHEVLLPTCTLFHVSITVAVASTMMLSQS